MAPPQMLWELVKNHNAFIRKGLHGVVLSAEPGNLYNKHSYKYSGLANDKAVDIAAGEGGVAVSKRAPKAASKPAKAVAASTNKRPVRRALQGVAKDVASYRPDLKAAALARFSAVSRSLRKKKAVSK